MTEEERQQMLRNRGQMIGAAQGALNLGGAVPAFPTNFQNINPQPAAPLIPFRGGGTAEMSVGGAQVNYPSRLTLSGGDYGTRFQFGAQEFGPARLPQAQPTNMLERQYTNPFATPSERMGETLTLGLTQLPTQQSTSISEGPVNMGIAGTQTAMQRGLQPIQTPRGTIYATAEQAANMQTPRTMAQSSSRTPEQQQALLAQMREAGAGIRQRITQGQQEFDQKSIQRGYAFRQGLAETAAQTALNPKYGSGPSDESKTRGAQALLEAERWKQARTGRNPMSRDALVFGSGGPQPAAASTTPSPSMAGPSAMRMGGSAFSYTPFAQRIQQPEPSPLSGFTAALNPTNTDRRFRPFPFGMRQFGVI